MKYRKTVTDIPGTHLKHGFTYPDTDKEIVFLDLTDRFVIIDEVTKQYMEMGVSEREATRRAEKLVYKLLKIRQDERERLKKAEKDDKKAAAGTAETEITVQTVRPHPTGEKGASLEVPIGKALREMTGINRDTLVNLKVDSRGRIIIEKVPEIQAVQKKSPTLKELSRSKR